MNIHVLQRIILLSFSSFIFLSNYTFASIIIPESEYKRPSNVPEDYIVTPNGYFHPSCVHEIKNDEIQSAGLVIEKVNGEVRKIEKCIFSNFSKYGVERNIKDNFSNKFHLNDGWQISASYTMDSSLGHMEVRWRVPDDPLVKQGQTLFFFPGVQQNPTVSILQPVLGWNQLGQEGWTLSSWNCCEDGTITHSAPIDTSSRALNIGKIYFDKKLNGYYIDSTHSPYTAERKTTRLATRFYIQPVNWVFGGVMENYNVSSCDSLPSNRSIMFSAIKVYDINNNFIKMPFKSYKHNEYCNYSSSIINSEFGSIIEFGF